MQNLILVIAMLGLMHFEFAFSANDEMAVLTTKVLKQ